MATMLNGTMGTAKSMFESAMNGASHASEKALDDAKDLAGSAKDGTEHAVASARSSVMDGIHAFTSAVAMIRNLGIADALGWVGLERRRNPLVSFGIFSAGFAAGAGAGVLFAPMSGAAMRSKLLKGFMGVEAKAEAEIKADAKMIEDKAEALAGKAKDAVMKAEQTVEHAVAQGADAVKHGAESAASAVKDTVKNATDDAKSVLASASNNGRSATNGTNATEVPKPDKVQGAAGSQHR